MLVRGQAPLSWSDEMTDVLAVLRSGFAPDGGGAGDSGAGDGQGSGSAAGAGGSGGDGQTGSDGQQFDAARAQALIAKLRDENKAAQAAAKERDDLAARLKEIEDKDKSDAEKAVSDLTRTQAELKAAQLEAGSLKAKYEGALKSAAIERAANAASAIDVETVAALVDRSEITIDEAGVVIGADKAVKALLTAKPFLVGQAGGTGTGVKTTPGTPAGAGGTSKANLMEQTKKELQQTGAYRPL